MLAFASSSKMGHLHECRIAATMRLITYTPTKNASYSQKPLQSDFPSNIRNCLVYHVSYVHLIRYICKHCNTTHVFLSFNNKTGQLSGIWSSRRAINHLIAAIQRPWRCLSNSIHEHQRLGGDVYFWHPFFTLSFQDMFHIILSRKKCLCYPSWKYVHSQKN